MAGAGSIYAHGAMDRSEDKRELRVASNVVTAVEPRATWTPWSVGGGPTFEPQTYFTPTDEQPLLATEAGEAEAGTIEDASVDAIVDAIVVEVALEEVGADVIGPVDVGPVEDAGAPPMAIVDAGAMPNVPYVAPVFVFQPPQEALTENFPVGPLGSTSVSAGAGALSPSVAPAGGTLVGNAGGTATGPGVTQPIAPEAAANPFVLPPTGVFVPVGPVPFLTFNPTGLQ